MDLILETERLRLRPLALDDLAPIVAGLGDFEVTRRLTRVPFPYREDDARAWLNSLAPPVHGKANFAIDLQGVGFVGVAGIESELGYWLARDWHGRGVMTEACLVLLDWHFAGLPDTTVRSSAHRGNAASLNVQHKLGFRPTGQTTLRHVRAQGQAVEHVETILTRPAFEAARRRLEHE